jgi:hypothetical protein
VPAPDAPVPSGPRSPGPREEGGIRPELRRFQNLSYEDFRRRAEDPTLAPEEKVGFPREYREGKESAIFADILRKLGALSTEGRTVLEVGPGCSGLCRLLIEHCRARRHSLVLVDSREMLGQIPDAGFIRKVPAYYPDECPGLFEELAERVDAFLVYSVIHYVFARGNVFDFLDRSLSLLAEGGELLIGDVPNVSKRRRFFSSRRGAEFHRRFTGGDDPPDVRFNALEPQLIDDSVVQAILQRSRNTGFDAYVLPQPDDLPMANRREDILIRRP